MTAPDVAEAEHFITCPECGQAIDCRRLGDVLRHDEPGHEPIVDTPLPALSFIEPMLPTLVDDPPAGDGWIHEIKYDEYRTQIVVDQGQARAFTRNGHDWSERYRPLLAAIEALGVERAIIDGEVIVQDAEGRSDFAALRTAIGREPRRLVFMAFDLLHQGATNLRPLAVEQRRERLEELLGANDPASPVHFSGHVGGNGADFFAAVDRLGLEGIVSKERGSRYLSGRARNWLKVKCWTESDFVVVGTEATPGEPVAALLAREIEDGLEHAGGGRHPSGQRQGAVLSRDRGACAGASAALRAAVEKGALARASPPVPRSTSQGERQGPARNRCRPSRGCSVGRHPAPYWNGPDVGHSLTSNRNCGIYPLRGIAAPQARGGVPIG